MTRAQVRQIAKGLERGGRGARARSRTNPLDAVWRDRPEPPVAAVSRAAGGAGRQAGRGEDRRDRQARRRQARRRRDPHRPRFDRLALQHPRRRHPAHALPAFLRRSSTQTGRPELFIDGRKLSNAIRDTLENVRRRARSARFLRAAGGARPARGARCSTTRTARPRRSRGSSRQAGGTIVEGADPIALPKARKNAAELAGSRAAHLRDGVAMLRFLRFIETSAPGSLTEIDAAKKLEALRAETAAEGDVPLADISFDVDLLHRPERRDQPLPRHREDQPAARSGRALSDRFRRAISRRHDRHHAHRADRRARRASGSTFSAIASRVC